MSSHLRIGKVCRGARAYVTEGLTIPRDCPHKPDVRYLIDQELKKPEKLIGKIADGARLAKRLFKR